jgi:heterogeneous nuclear ribonucleoprotein R
MSKKINIKIKEGVHEVTVSTQLDSEINNNNNSIENRFKNRGFCFVEFIDHKSASIAKRKLSMPRHNKIFNRDIIVDWADQNEEPDEEIMSKVKVLFVKNLSNDISEQDLERYFEPYGKLERIRKMNNFAFIHFDQRENALKAMEQLNNKVSLIFDIN